MTDQSTRLEALIQAPETIEYLDTNDKEFPEIRWTVFGAPATNEIIVRAQVREKTYYASAPSQLAYPLMEDRIFGIDVSDNHLAQALSNQMWEQHGEEMQAVLSVPEKPDSST